MFYRADDIGITAVGLVSPIGYSAETACAAARAGISRLAEIDLFNAARMGGVGEEPASGHCIRQLAHGFGAYAKSMLLAEHALKDLLAKRPLSRQEQSSTSLTVILSDRYFEDHVAHEQRRGEEEAARAGGQNETEDADEPTEPFEPPSERWRRRCRHFVPELLSRLDLALPEHGQNVIFGGHAAVVDAVEAGMRAIAQGDVERVLIGAVDSLVEPSAFEAAAACGVIACEANAAGFFPSEAAGFVLFERSPSMSVVRAWAKASDEPRMTERAALGRGTMLAIKEVLEPEAGQRPVGLVLADLNGDPERARDWGHALVRLDGRSNIRDRSVFLPAFSFGEAGAAQGVVAAIYAARGFQRPYWPASQSVLICLASEAGERGALLLERVGE